MSVSGYNSNSSVYGYWKYTDKLTGKTKTNLELGDDRGNSYPVPIENILSLQIDIYTTDPDFNKFFITIRDGLNNSGSYAQSDNSSVFNGESFDEYYYDPRDAGDISGLITVGGKQIELSLANWLE